MQVIPDRRGSAKLYRQDEIPAQLAFESGNIGLMGIRQVIRCVAIVGQLLENVPTNESVDAVGLFRLNTRGTDTVSYSMLARKH